MGCDPGLNERGKGKKLLECFPIWLLLDPPSYEKPLPATTVGFPKALPTRPSHHNGWYPLKPRAKRNLSFSCFLLVIYKERRAHTGYVAVWHSCSQWLFNFPPSLDRQQSLPLKKRIKAKTVFTPWRDRGQRTTGQWYRCPVFTAYEWKMSASPMAKRYEGFRLSLKDELDRRE